MHMADALLSPAVGGTMWAASASAIAYASKEVSKELEDRRIPLMGVLGAFLFAAQMINFSIPGTGSSGHLGGGILLAVLLGPHAALLTIASVLVVQALFFADGGLLALGCNIFNMGIIPAFLVYPLIYRKIAGAAPTRARLNAATIGAAVIGLQLGPLAVVLETTCSRVSSLPFATFLLLMQPIHLAIGAVEGVVTVAVLSFVWKARPDLMQTAHATQQRESGPLRPLVIGFLVAALFTAGCLSLFASKNPDGLEWAVAKVTGKESLKGAQGSVHGVLAELQKKVAFFPDYGFPPPSNGKTAPAAKGAQAPEELGTGIAGVVGAAITLAVAVFGGFLLKRRKAA